MNDFITGFSQGCLFLASTCCVALCLFTWNIAKDVHEIKRYLKTETEEVADTIYVHKKDTIIQYVYGNEEE